MKLRIADSFGLPTEAVTQTFAILAKRGAGKTYTACVMAEEMLAANLPLVICDPIGVWWGLRASADGKSPGLPIVVIGGDHGDVPLSEVDGETIAQMIVEERLQCVIDLSRFRKGEQTRFMTEFAETLYRLNRQPLHVFLDEADAFAPQRPQRGEERLLGAIEDIVRRGRARGLGVTLITQRAAVLNKNVLTQIEVLVCLRTIAPQDRAAIETWVEVHGTPEQSQQLLSSLPSLPIGTAWFWSPGWLDTFRQVNIRKRKTFDSSATPKVGTAPVAPKLAPVDLVKLRERIGETIERAKADDPRELRRQIVELERKLRTAKIPAPAPEVLTQEREAGREEIRRTVREAFPSLDRATWLAGQIAENSQTLRGILDRASIIVDSRPSVPTAHPDAVRQSKSPVRAAAPGTKLAAGERKILTVLAQYPTRSKVQVALIAGYSVNGGGFGNYLGSLRSRGWIEGKGDGLQITAAGRAALGPHDPLPTGTALLEYWLGQVGKAERLILEALGRISPQWMTKEQLGEATGYQASGGGFGNALGRLRTLELITRGAEIRLAEELL